MLSTHRDPWWIPLAEPGNAGLGRCRVGWGLAGGSGWRRLHPGDLAAAAAAALSRRSAANVSLPEPAAGEGTGTDGPGLPTSGQLSPSTWGRGHPFACPSPVPSPSSCGHEDSFPRSCDADANRAKRSDTKAVSFPLLPEMRWKLSDLTRVTVGNWQRLCSHAWLHKDLPTPSLLRQADLTEWILTHGSCAVTHCQDDTCNHNT